MTETNYIEEIAKEIVYWAFFSVVMALAQLWLLPLIYYIANRPVSWVQLVGNGSLLVFATTITSKSAGDYFKRVRQHRWWATILCFGGTIVIIVISIGLYALVTARGIGLLGAHSLAAARVTTMSDMLAFFSVVLSLSYTLLARAYGE